jgi:hypothetical protein
MRIGLAVCVAAIALGASTAQAAFPGANGKIAYTVLVTQIPTTASSPVRPTSSRSLPNPDRVFLRAEHSRGGDGRVYHVAFTASDGKGGECAGVAKVEVRQGESLPAVDSAPPSHDSLTPSTTP